MSAESRGNPLRIAATFVGGLAAGGTAYYAINGAIIAALVSAAVVVGIVATAWYRD